MKMLTLGNRCVGEGYPPFLVAEISCNHQHNFAQAEALIHAAYEAGADAVKLQTYTPDTMTIDSKKPWFFIDDEENPESWQKKTFYELYKESYTPWEWHRPLQELATRLGLQFFSTPFDPTAVAFLETLDVPCYKIASYECCDFPLLRAVARTGKPIIMSVGFATCREIAESLSWLRQHGAKQIALLYCLTSYKEGGDVSHTNLATLQDMKERFSCVVGFSDNMGGIDVPEYAASLGASIIEKHLVLRHDPEVLDDRFSLDVDEFRTMVTNIRTGVFPSDPVWKKKVVGQVHYGCQSPSEEKNSRYRRSLFVVKDMKDGDLFTEENVRSLRPHVGLDPKYLYDILGKKALHSLEKGSPVTWDLIDDGQPLAVEFRNVTVKDMDLLYLWRNDPKVREVCFHSEELFFDEHRKYWKKRLADSFHSYLLIHEGVAIGLVRLDHREGGYEVHLFVAPEWQGRGFGRETLLALQELARKNSFPALFARIKAENLISRHLFEMCGFSKSGAWWEWYTKTA